MGFCFTIVKQIVLQGVLSEAITPEADDYAHIEYYDWDFNRITEAEVGDDVRLKLVMLGSSNLGSNNTSKFSQPALKKTSVLTFASNYENGGITGPSSTVYIEGYAEATASGEYESWVEDWSKGYAVAYLDVEGEGSPVSEEDEMTPAEKEYLENQ